MGRGRGTGAGSRAPAPSRVGAKPVPKTAAGLIRRRDELMRERAAARDADLIRRRDELMRERQTAKDADLVRRRDELMRERDPARAAESDAEKRRRLGEEMVRRVVRGRPVR